jgi:HlyD family secretion protein
MRRYRTYITVGCLLAVAALTISGCGRGKETAQAAEGPKAQPVKVAPVELGEIVVAHETTGTVTAATEAEVAAKVEQRILSLPYREGDAVPAGAVLARLDDTEARRQVQMAEAEARVAQAQLRDLLAGARTQEVAQARAALQQAQATESKATQALRHAREVYGKGGLPEQTIAAAEGKAQVARAQVETATANLENARGNYQHFKEQVDLDAEPRLRVQEARGRLRSAEAQVATAKTTVVDAQRDLDRVTEMKQIGGASQEAVDKAQARLEMAQAQLRSAESSRDTAQEGLDRAEEIYKLRAQPQQQLEDARTKLQAAEAQVRAAREASQAAETDLAHVRQLYSGPIPQRELDDAEARVAEARAATEAARQRLSLLQAGASVTQIAVARERVQQAQAKVGAAQVTLSYCTVKAPLTGTVIRRYLDVGDMAGPRAPILTVATRGHLVVKAALADRYAGQVFVGAPLTVTGATLAKPLPLTVTRVYQSADPKTRLMPFEAALPPGLKLAVGSLIQVRLVVQKAVGVPVVPVEALLSRPGGKRVAFVVEEEKAVQRPVEVGLEANGKAEVRSGLRVGDKLIVGGQEMLRDKMPVKVGGAKKPGDQTGTGGRGVRESGPAGPEGKGLPAGGKN